MLPWLVRGRSLSADVVAASAWAAGVAATTIALGEWLGDRVGQAEPHGAGDAARWSPARPRWRSPSCAAPPAPEPGGPGALSTGGARAAILGPHANG